MRLKETVKEREVKSESGIILEIKKQRQIQTEQEATVDAYIIAIGSTANLYLDSHDGTGQPEYKVGDLVTIGKYAGRLIPDIFDEDSIYRLIKDIDIHGKFVGQELNDIPEHTALKNANHKETLNSPSWIKDNVVGLTEQ